MEKNRRVKTAQDFQKVISSKKRINSNSYVIYFRENENVDISRFGISASKKLGKAVIRVKVRRQVRSMIREILKQVNIKKLDYVIIVRKDFLNNDYQKNLEDLKQLFMKFGGITNAKNK